MRPAWSGAISFGLIYIPVKLYSASKTRKFKFHYLRKKDMCPIAYVKVCKETGAEVDFKDIVKGYEYEKGDYVILDDQDFKKAYPKKSEVIEVLDFVDEKEVELKFLERPFYVEPAKGAKKVYVLLREALKKSRKAGISKFVMKTKEYLGLLTVEGDMIILYQMRFNEEIAKPTDLDLPDKGAKAGSQKELELAVKLIDQLTVHFVPEKYKDTFNEKIEKIIEDKMKGKAPRPREEKPDLKAVPDIMAQLKESLKVNMSKREHHGSGKV